MTDTAYFRAMTTTSQNLNPSYGYLWWLNGKGSFMLPQSQVVFPGNLVPAAPDDLIAALGLNDQIIHVVPSDGIVLIRMGNAASGLPVSVNLSNEIWERMYKVMCNQQAVRERSALEAIAIFPNPADRFIQIKNSSNENVVSVELLDITGKTIKISESAWMSTEDLKEGIYLLKISTSAGTVIKKVLIQK